MGIFSNDKIILTLEKYDFKPGEKITGKIKLNLKKPTKARKLEVSLIGQRKESHKSSRGTTSYQTTNVFDFNLPLGMEKEYHNSEYNFEIKIPDDILKQTRAPNTSGFDGAFEKAVSVGIALAGKRYYPMEWLIRVHLDVPMKLDIKKSQEIILSEN